MSWRLIDKPKTQAASKKLAKEFAEMDPAPQDRPLSERRLQVYEKIMRAGGFRPVSWASAYCISTSGTYRVNGKHTSVLLSGMENPPELYVTVERYECDELEDVARLYATYDSKMQSRTIGDINRSFAATIPELVDVASRNINLVVGAIAYFKQPTASGRDRDQPADRAEALFDNIGFALWIERLLGRRHGSGKTGHLCRMPVVAAMYGGYLKSQRDASAFWAAVRDETGERPDLPDRKLARWLLTATSRIGNRSDKPLRYRVSDREIYAKCVHGWNAWRKGESTNLNYYAEAKLPNIV